MGTAVIRATGQPHPAILIQKGIAMRLCTITRNLVDQGDPQAVRVHMAPKVRNVLTRDQNRQTLSRVADSRTSARHLW